MNNTAIFVITVMNSKHYFEKFHQRSVGFYHEKENAERDIRNNSFDINEGTYDIVVIEETNPGIYSLSRNRWFYKFDKDSGKYKPIEEPEEFIGTINFGIG